MQNTTAYLTTTLCLIIAFFLLMIVFLITSIHVVREDKRLSVYRLGRHVGDKGPGLVLLIPFIDRGEIIELDGVEKTPSRRLVGAVGEAITTVFTSGRILLASEEWEAISQTPIATGRRVRVVRMILEVEEE